MYYTYENNNIKYLCSFIKKTILPKIEGTDISVFQIMYTRIHFLKNMSQFIS